jgi:uncharacterized protein YceK
MTGGCGEIWPVAIKRARSARCMGSRAQLVAVGESVPAWCVHIVHHIICPITAFRDTFFLMHVQFGPPPYYVYRFGLEGKNVVCAVTTSLIMTALR